MDITAPDGPPENVHVVATSPFGINISWSEPAVITGPTFYLIDVKSVDNDDFNISFVKSNEENKTIEINDLKVFTRYSVVITAFIGNVSGAYAEGKTSTEVIITTLESVPKDPPNNVTFQKIPDEVTKFQLTFLPPSQPNGNIQVYQALVYREDDPTAVQIHNLSIIQKTDTSVVAVLEGLKGGHTYNISWTSYMSSLIPTFTCQNANVMHQLRDLLLDPMHKTEKLNSKKSVIYGSEIVPDNVNITKSKGDCYPGFDMDKWFKFRATNVMGQFTDSDYSDPIKTLGEGLSERTVEIILSVTLCILSIILLGTAIFAFARIRQKQKEGGTYSPREAEIIDTKFKLDQLITVADLELKDERLTRYSSFFFRRKEIFVIQPISKKSFLQHVEELCTNNNLKFQEEFS
ncbi:hypothetical protein STEG23_013034, partial [Scotinomys teguina]